MYRSESLAYIENWKELKNFDTEILCADGQCSAHRLVLCHASPYMGSLLDDQFPGETTYYSLPDVKTSTMSLLLDLAYTGKITCTKDALQHMEEAMKFLGWIRLDCLNIQAVEKDVDEQSEYGGANDVAEQQSTCGGIDEVGTENRLGATDCETYGISSVVDEPQNLGHLSNICWNTFLGEISKDPVASVDNSGDSEQMVAETCAHVAEESSPSCDTSKAAEETQSSVVGNECHDMSGMEIEDDSGNPPEAEANPADMELTGNGNQVAEQEGINIHPSQEQAFQGDSNGGEKSSTPHVDGTKTRAQKRRMTNSVAESSIANGRPKRQAAKIYNGTGTVTPISPGKATNGLSPRKTADLVSRKIPTTPSKPVPSTPSKPVPSTPSKPAPSTPSKPVPSTPSKSTPSSPSKSKTCQVANDSPDGKSGNKVTGSPEDCSATNWGAPQSSENEGTVQAELSPGKTLTRSKRLAAVLRKQEDVNVVRTVRKSSRRLAVMSEDVETTKDGVTARRESAETSSEDSCESRNRKAQPSSSASLIPEEGEQSVDEELGESCSELDRLGSSGLGHNQIRAAPLFRNLVRLTPQTVSEDDDDKPFLTLSFRGKEHELWLCPTEKEELLGVSSLRAAIRVILLHFHPTKALQNFKLTNKFYANSRKEMSKRQLFPELHVQFAQAVASYLFDFDSKTKKRIQKEFPGRSAADLLNARVRFHISALFTYFRDVDYTSCHHGTNGNTSPKTPKKRIKEKGNGVTQMQLNVRRGSRRISHNLGGTQAPSDDDSNRESWTGKIRGGLMNVTEWKKITTCTVCKESFKSPEDAVMCLKDHKYVLCWMCLDGVPVGEYEYHAMYVHQGKSSMDNVICKWCGEEGTSTWLPEHLVDHSPGKMD